MFLIMTEKSQNNGEFLNNVAYKSRY